MSVILYNYRYRGPYEYDKFIYNTLQLSNEIDILEAKVNQNGYRELRKDIDELDKLLNKLTGENSYLQKLTVYEAQVSNERIDE